MDEITTLGIDLAERVFALHGMDGTGRTLLRRVVRREALLSTVRSVPRCLIAMEACSGAHAWARQFMVMGHTVRLIAPRFVTPYRKSGKNDGNDVWEPNARLSSGPKQSVLINRPVIVTQSRPRATPLQLRGSPYVYGQRRPMLGVRCT